MNKIFTALLCTLMSVSAFAQWNTTTMRGENTKPAARAESYYSLNLSAMRNKLSNAQEMGKSATPVIINVPVMGGKIERFAVYSFPVVVKSLADQYHLGSYTGVGIDDPEKFIRFSVSPFDFQSMIFKNGEMEFVEPMNKERTVYGVHPKTNKTEGSWLCSTNEDIASTSQIEKMLENGQVFTNDPSNFTLSSDKKYRTVRLAQSVTGEYTTYYEGVDGAIAQINATLTRVNGVYEKDLALHLILQEYPQLVYPNAATDPYTNPTDIATTQSQLQSTLNSVVGAANYDIGHIFHRTGGGGNAGCIGCVCLAGKGMGYTSPGSGAPEGDNFDIDYVAHEMGHQLGANHTFSHSLEGFGQNVEPGSGSTIMGYAGITSQDVQPHSDAYFVINSINQIQNNLNLGSKTCDIETPIANNPPVITAMTPVTIPRNTPFVLTAEATDPEGDTMTYTWEQTNSATTPTTKTNAGTLTNGPNFRSLPPTTNPTRYFPKLSTVMSGVLKNTNTPEWEAISTVARSMNFTVTVRDNNANANQQQTASATRAVTVNNAGPFKINTTGEVFTNTSDPVTWDVVGTNAAPFNVPNVKVDYTTDGGNTWTVLAASTANDGSEAIDFSSIPAGTPIYLRISAIDNIFYALANLMVSQIVQCDGSAPVALAASAEDVSATISCGIVQGTPTYNFYHRKQGDTNWIPSLPSATNSVLLTNLEASTVYEYYVTATCSGTEGSNSAIATFTTAMTAACTAGSTNTTGREWISNVTVGAEGGQTMSGDSGASTYSDYTMDAARQITLYANSANNTISVSKAWASTKYNEGIVVWIDFNRSGTFEANEIILQSPSNQDTPITTTFAVPATSYIGDKPVRMRVNMRFNSNVANACGNFTFGEVEDYAVYIPSVLAVSENTKDSQIQVYPNPAKDVLNISKVSDRATYVIHSVSGQLISKGNISDGKVNVSKLQKGVYVISIDDSGNKTNVKFVKE